MLYKKLALHLKDVLVVLCCHPLQFGCVAAETSDRIPPKRGNEAKSGTASELQNDYQEEAHRQSSSWRAVLSTASRIRRRCINVNFQSPSSTSCIRSIMNMRNKLKPNFDRRVENAFWTGASSDWLCWQRE